MSDLVLDHMRRREVSDALGLSFGRIRALRRVARQPTSMKELSTALGIDPPNATAVVDDLESLRLVRRAPHPTDRRAKLVKATDLGREQARRADEILLAPPPALKALCEDDLEALLQLLRRAAGGGS